MTYTTVSVWKPVVRLVPLGVLLNASPLVLGEVTAFEHQELRVQMRSIPGYSTSTLEEQVD